MKTKVRCPFCVHDFEVETVPEIKPEDNKLLHFVQSNLELENQNLKWENQRLQIEMHRHRGE